MSRTFWATTLSFLAVVSSASAQDRYVFGYTHTEDGLPTNPVRLLTDRGVFNATARGWFDQSGFHHQANDNYIAGWYDGMWYRNFFLFDVGDRSGPFAWATLRVYNPFLAGPQCYGTAPCRGYSSPNATELYRVGLFAPQFHDDVFLRALGRTDIFAALAAGPAVGERRVGPADDGHWVDIRLTDGGLDALNRSTDRFGVGGHLASTDVDLVVTPEPTAVILTATGLLLLGLARRRPTSS